MFVICTLITIVLLNLYFHFTKTFNYWKIQKIPFAPNAIPGLGHVLSLLLVKDTLSMWIAKLYKKMDKRSMYGCYFMQTPALIVRDPELIKSVLHTNFTSFHNNMIRLNENLDPILSKNPFFARDEVWKESRIILGNNFSGKTLRCVFLILLDVCDQLNCFIDKNNRSEKRSAELELKELFQRVTGEMVANAAFGIEGQSFKSNPDYQAFTNVAKRLFETTKENGVRQALRFCFPNIADLIGLSFIPKETDSYFRDNIRSIIKSRLENGTKTNDFLRFIIERMGKIDEDMAVAQATSLFFDGYETSSSVLSFLTYHLAENPCVQEKVRDEINGVIKKFNNKLSYEALKNMNYLEQVMNESMRLNPALGDIAKVCNEKITLQGYDKLKCTLQPGDVVLISAIGVHLDGEYWPDSTKFDPERFNASRKLERNKYTYLAFGEGARICIGKRMGIMTVKTVIALLLQNYVLEPSCKTKKPLRMNPNTFAWVAKGGLWVHFKKIEKLKCST